MLAKGTKVPSPHVRATGKNGTIHAVDRPNEPVIADLAAVKTLCGKATLPPDEPLRRFQQGLGKECQVCTGKVVQARMETIRQRKALRSKKNQPQAAQAAQTVKPTDGKVFEGVALKVNKEKISKPAVSKTKAAVKSKAAVKPAASKPTKPTNTRVRKPAVAKA